MCVFVLRFSYRHFRTRRLNNFVFSQRGAKALPKNCIPWKFQQPSLQFDENTVKEVSHLGKQCVKMRTRQCHFNRDCSKIIGGK